MKRLIAIATLAAGLPFAMPASAGVDVGVSIGISQPGVYGRIDIGRFPVPHLVLPQPVWVRPVHVRRPPPVYMWVPPGHQKNWRRHCGRYDACGVPVYFVRDDWYRQQIRPRGDGHPGYAWRDERWDRRADRRDDRWDRRDDRRGDRWDRRDDRRDDRWDRRDDRRDDRGGRGPG